MKCGMNFYQLDILLTNLYSGFLTLNCSGEGGIFLEKVSVQGFDVLRKFVIEEKYQKLKRSIV